MARNTRIFTDLDLNFTANPSTGDISKKFDENAVKQSIRNLLLTNNYERPFHPEIGTQLNSLLFEPFSPLLEATLRQSIIVTLQNFEPRVKVIQVDVTLNPDNHTVYVSIIFNIVNTTNPLTVNLTLQRTR